MVAPLGFDGVMARIGAIESKFGTASASGSSTASLTPTPGSLAGFEPFGDAYQAALDAAGGGARTDGNLSHANASQAYATPLQPGATATVGGFPSVVGTNPVGGVAGVGGTRYSLEVAAPGVRPIGGYGKMPVPPELAPYGNGRIPPDRLVRIGQGNHRLYAPAAASWDQVVQAARDDGIDLRITDSYRSYDQQVDLVRRKGLYSEGGLGARPGTSNHGWGLAVDADVRDPDVLAWVRENAPRFGWVEAAPREPWHWEFRPHQV